MLCGNNIKDTVVQLKEWPGFAGLFLFCLQKESAGSSEPSGSDLVRQKTVDEILSCSRSAADQDENFVYKMKNPMARSLHQKKGYFKRHPIFND